MRSGLNQSQRQIIFIIRLQYLIYFAHRNQNTPAASRQPYCNRLIPTATNKGDAIQKRAACVSSDGAALDLGTINDLERKARTANITKYLNAVTVYCIDFVA